MYGYWQRICESKIIWSKAIKDYSIIWGILGAFKGHIVVICVVWIFSTYCGHVSSYLDIVGAPMKKLLEVVICFHKHWKMRRKALQFVSQHTTTLVSKPISIFVLLLLHFLVVKPTLYLCLIVVVVVVASCCCSSDKIKMVAGGRDAGCAECIGLEGLPRNGRSWVVQTNLPFSPEACNRLLFSSPRSVAQLRLCSV